MMNISTQIVLNITLFVYSTTTGLAIASHDQSIFFMYVILTYIETGYRFYSIYRLSKIKIQFYSRDFFPLPDDEYDDHDDDEEGFAKFGRREMQYDENRSSIAGQFELIRPY